MTIHDCTKRRLLLGGIGLENLFFFRAKLVKPYDLYALIITRVDNGYNGHEIMILQYVRFLPDGLIFD